MILFVVCCGGERAVERGKWVEEREERVKATKRTCFTNSRSGSSNPSRRATIAMVVLSPPGITRASHCESWAVVRTWMKLNCGVDVDEESVDCCDDSWTAAFWRREMCSMTPPWRARTPTVICWGVTVSTVIVSLSKISMWCLVGRKR